MGDVDGIYDVRPGQVMIATSDVGWAVGHCYNVYGPLIAETTSILYEGLPTHPDPGIWWRTCERYGVRTIFSAPTAIRVLKKQDNDELKGQVPVLFATLKQAHGERPAPRPRPACGSAWWSNSARCATGAGVRGQRAAQDPLGQAAAALDPGAGRGA